MQTPPRLLIPTCALLLATLAHAGGHAAPALLASPQATEAPGAEAADASAEPKEKGTEAAGTPAPDSDPDTDPESDPATAEEVTIPPPSPLAALDATPQGQAVQAAWVKAAYAFTPEVRAAYLTLVKAEAKAELAKAGQSMPADFLAWVDADPVVEATVYGAQQPPVNVLRMLRSLDLDLGADVVRKEYTQIALAMSVANAHMGPKADLTPRQPMTLVIPPCPLKRVDTKDPHRALDQDDHIINFLEEHPFEYEVKLPPATAGGAPVVEKRSRPLTGADVIKSKEWQAKFNAYMEAKGQAARVDCLPAGPRPIPERAKTSAAGQMFTAAYVAKGRLPAKRDPIPSVAETCAFLIRNDRFRFPAESQRAWPVYPLKSPWPTLTFLAVKREPLRECEDIWQHYVKTGGFRGVRYVGWVAQHASMLTASAVAPLDFAEGSLQMMMKNGGVCGAVSNVLARSRQVVGQPATTYSTKGHCGYAICYYDPKNDIHSVGGGASLRRSNLNAAPWVFDKYRSRQAGIYHSSTFWGTNYGLQSYLDSMLAYGVYDRLAAADRKAHGIPLIESGLAINPYNILLSNAAKDADPLSQLRLLRKMEATMADVAAKAKPGCPASTMYLKPNLMAALATAPIPADPAVVRELHAFMQQEKNVPPMALARYNAAIEGLPATLAKTEAALKAHLASVRTPATCTAMAADLSSAAAQITDKKERQAWAQKCLETMTGHEMMFWGRQYAFYTDPAAQTAAQLAGKRLPKPTLLIQPLLDETTAKLAAQVSGERHPKTCAVLAGQIGAVAGQLTDPAQKKQWLEKLSQTLAGHETFSFPGPRKQKVAVRDACADVVARLLAPPAAPVKK